MSRSFTLPLAASAASLLLSASAFAATPVVLRVDEGGFLVPDNQLLTEEANLPAVQATGFDPITLNIHTAVETETNFTIADAHAEWVATNPFAPGVVQVFNFNILEEDGSNNLSDTLSITLTGQTPTAGDLNNMSLDFHFRSNPLGTSTQLPFLSGGISLVENGFFQSINAFLPTQFTADPASPLSVSFRSDVVPEPASLATFALGAAALLRRRSCRT